MTDGVIEYPGPIVVDPGTGKPIEIIKPDPVFGKVEIKWLSLEELAQDRGNLSEDSSALLEILDSADVEGGAMIWPNGAPAPLSIKYEENDESDIFLKIEAPYVAELQELAGEGSFDEIDAFIFDPKPEAKVEMDVGLVFIKIGDAMPGALDHKVELVEQLPWDELADYGTGTPHGGFDDILL